MSTKQKKWTAVISVASILTLSLGAFAACGGEEHTLTPVDAKQPTCTEAGNEAYYLCSHCGKLFADENAETEVSDADVTLAALGHELTHHDAVATTCTENGNIEYWSCSRCELNFSDAEATKQVGSVTTTASHDIVLVGTVEPTAESEGVKEHYECTVCKTYFADPYGEEEADKEDYVLDKLVSQSVSITVEIYDLSGALIEDAAAYEEISGELALVGSYSTNTYENLTVNADRSLGVDSLCVGSYQIDADGFRRASFEVTAGTTDYTLRLEETIAYGSNDNVTVNDSEGTISFAALDMQNNAWTGSAELILPEDLGNDTFVFNATLKMGDYTAGWTTEGTQQRYAIQLLSNNVGFYFWSWDSSGYKSHIRLFATNNLNNAMAENADVNADEAALGFMTESLLGEEGLQLRIFRTSTEFALFAWNGTEWTHLGSIDISSYGEIPARIVLYGAQASYVWSDIGIQTLTYVAASEPSAEKPGNHAYYTDGTRYWFEDFEETTAEDVMIYMPVSVTLNLSAIALDGKTAAHIPEGTVITLTGRSNVYTYTVGESDVLNMTAGSYTVSADGYRTIQLNVPATGGEINVTLTQVIYIPAQPMVNNAWTSGELIAVPETITGDFVLEMTLNMGNYTAGWTTESTQQRYAIRLTEGNVGFYFWSWDSNGYKTRIRQFGENNLTNAMAENDDVNADESGLGFFVTELLSKEGLRIRIVRMGTTFMLEAMNGDVWVNLGSVSCAEGDPTEIEVYGAQASYEWSNINFAALEYVAEKQPSVSEPGNVAYYTDGTNYWLPDGTQTTAEDVLVYMPVAVTLNFSCVGLDGSPLAALPDGLVITFTSRVATYTYTVGGAAITEMLIGDYTVTADGFRTIQLNVSATGGELNVALTQVIALQGSVEDYTSNQWSDSATLEIGQNIADSTAVILEFTIKNVTNSQAGWPTDEWASQRLAIQMAAGNEGFLFFLPKGEANIFDMTDNTISDGGKTRFGESGTTYAWVDTLMRTANGVQMRLVRTGENVTLYVLNESEQWVKIGTVACADAQTEIIFYGCGVTWEFSSVTVDELTYVAEKQPTASEQGNVAYYTDGTNYWFEDGSQTTAEDVAINAVSVSLSFSATELDASKPASLADGTVITLTGKFNTYTYTVGGTALTQMYADTYTVTVDGYATATLVVPEEGGELTVTLHKALTIGKGAVALTNNAWAGQEKLTVPDGLTTGDFVFEATLNMRDFLSGWDTIQTQQRYAIRLTEGNVGFYFWSWNSGGTRTHIRQFGENNLTNAMAENADVNGDEAGLGYIVDELLSDEGLRIRITRTGTTFKLEVMNGDAWAELGSVTCAEGDAADIELYAGAGTYVWSNITINSV